MDKPIYTILGPQRYQISILLEFGAYFNQIISNSTSPSSRADSTQLGSSDRDTKKSSWRLWREAETGSGPFTHRNLEPFPSPSGGTPDFSFEKGMIFSTAHETVAGHTG